MVVLHIHKLRINFFDMGHTLAFCLRFLSVCVNFKIYSIGSLNVSSICVLGRKLATLNGL